MLRVLRMLRMLRMLRTLRRQRDDLFSTRRPPWWPRLRDVCNPVCRPADRFLERRAVSSVTHVRTDQDDAATVKVACAMLCGAVFSKRRIDLLKRRGDSKRVMLE